MNGTILGILALLLAAGSVVLWFRRIRNVSVPRNRSAFVAIWLASALLGAFALVQGAGFLGGVLPLHGVDQSPGGGVQRHQGGREAPGPQRSRRAR
jgi:hypothetical protein